MPLGHPRGREETAAALGDVRLAPLAAALLLAGCGAPPAGYEATIATQATQIAYLLPTATPPPTPTPTSTPTPAPTATPTVAPTPESCEPATGDASANPDGPGLARFRAQVRAAEGLLEQDPIGYQRYCATAARFAETVRQRRVFVCQADLPRGILARALPRALAGRGTCAIQVSSQGAFFRGRSPREQQLILASILSHESTHLARIAGVPWEWLVRIDRAWIESAVREEVADFTAGALARVRRQADAQRATLQARIEAEAAEARAEASARLTAEIDAELQRTLLRYPNLTREQRAELEEARQRSLARGEAELAARLAAWSATARADGEANVAGALAEAEREVRRGTRELVEKDRVAGYLRAHEGGNAGGNLTKDGRTDVIREECWAQHEGLYTYTTIGGTDPEMILDLVLWLDTPECRAHLNLR